MKTFLKTLVGGALGLGALYVVGKICYEAGKDVAEVEHQLAENNAAEPKAEECEGQIHMNLDGDSGLPAMDKTPADVAEEAQDADDAHTEKTTAFGKLMSRFRNAKTFMTVRKVFDKGNRSPGILGSLLTNPDGAKIEAFVRDGGVQINVRPRTA